MRTGGALTPRWLVARSRKDQGDLWHILTRQLEICEAQRKVILKESLAGPSPYERAAEIAPTHPNARLMRRMQDANFREARRVTNLLLKIKRQERRMEALKEGDEKRGSVSGDRLEKKGVSAGKSKPLKTLSHSNKRS